jgi:hypothetical protein
MPELLRLVGVFWTRDVEGWTGALGGGYLLNFRFRSCWTREEAYFSDFRGTTREKKDGVGGRTPFFDF